MDPTNGTNFDFSVTISNAVADVNWRIKGTGDFNRDTKADILWSYPSDGRCAVWYMDGTNRLSTASILTGDTSLTNTNWKMRGSADYNGDAFPDILWQYTAGTGTNKISIMSPSDLNNPTMNYLLPSEAVTTWYIGGPR